MRIFNLKLQQSVLYFFLLGNLFICSVVGAIDGILKMLEWTQLANLGFFISAGYFLFSLFLILRTRKKSSLKYCSELALLLIIFSASASAYLVITRGAINPFGVILHETVAPWLNQTNFIYWTIFYCTFSLLLSIYLKIKLQPLLRKEH